MKTRRILVTGCASGIGRDVAQTLVAAGHRVLATDRAMDSLRDAAAGWPGARARVRQLDVTKPDDWRAAVAEAQDAFEGLDVLINVAGVLVPGWSHELPDSAVDLHFDVNAKGVVHGTRAVVPGMIAQRDGHIINVASLAALTPVAGLAMYAASKHAARAYSLSVAVELRDHGIAVTVVCPDAVQTPMLDIQRDEEAAAMTFSGSRVLQAEDVTQAIVQAMERRPLEVLVPPLRGWLAKLGDLLPGGSRAIEPLLRRRGRKRQQKR